MSVRQKPVTKSVARVEREDKAKMKEKLRLVAKEVKRLDAPHSGSVQASLPKPFSFAVKRRLLTHEVRHDGISGTAAPRSQHRLLLA
jgi:hypothetical protein